jgi:UTP--glucose-1-phosphate uridylyltransferase
VAADFAPFEARMRAAGLPDLAIRTFRHYYQALVAGAQGLLSRDEIEPVTEVERADALPPPGAAAEAALRRTVVIKLNGGLGTSMGMTRAKSLLPVKDGLTFLDVIARQVLHLRRATGCHVPLVLMNSFRTREDSLGLLGRYEKLSGDLPPDFLQHKVPRIREDDLSPAVWPANPEYEWCPPGHGDLYTALVTSGLLGELRRRGFAHAFVSNSDNLGAVLDPRILAWFAGSGVPFAMEVCDRTESDRKGGHLARLPDGRLTLRESAQCPRAERASFEDVGLWRYFNTNSLWLDLVALERLLAGRDGVLGLPLIRNVKSIDPQDDASARVIQLETAMGAAISVFEGARALLVPRERFAPVKTTSDLLALWSDAFVLSEDQRLVPAPGRRAGDLVVDLDPAFFRRIDDLFERFPSGAPSLRECTRFVVAGDVRFGAGVTCRGAVRVEAAPGETRRIPDGALLGG